jgi:GGDEF domain-containing protein
MLIGNEVLIGIVSTCKTTVRGYDYHGRFGEAEFAITLRHANALGVASVAQRLLRHLAMAVNRIVPQGSLVLEFSTATYPFDAETIPDLLSTARCHWTSSANKPTRTPRMNIENEMYVVIDG